MILPDVNVLVYAHREDAHRHGEYRRWLESVMTSPSAYGMSDLVLSGFLRIVTHPRVFAEPTPLPVALEFVSTVRNRPNCVRTAPGPRHWSIFESLCEAAEPRGNAVPDAWLAAMAIESGAEWVTTDLGFQRYPGLRVVHPLE